jgi:hypothetical protein
MDYYAPCYDPPLTEKTLAEHRDETFNSPDQEQFLHIGHFISWYATAEFALTMILHQFSGRIHPSNFHLLTLGMDAKLKAERLKHALKLATWIMDGGLLKRMEHFGQTHVKIRNYLVHSHPYWPEGGDLQLTSIGYPPTYKSQEWNAPPPFSISGLELYERGIWLNLFSQDLMAALAAIPFPIKPGGVLGTGRYLSSLPTGDRPSPETLKRRATAGKPAQNQSGK